MTARSAGRPRRRGVGVALPDRGAAIAAKPARRSQLAAIAFYPLDWLEERSGLIVGAIHYFLFRKVTRDTSWFHTLGSATLTTFLVQAITGVVLAFYYKPDPDFGLRVGPVHHERSHPRLARCAACTSGVRASSSS